MCVHCVRVSLNPMIGVIIFISVKCFERAFVPEKHYIRTSYYYYQTSNSVTIYLILFFCPEATPGCWVELFQPS